MDYSSVEAKRDDFEKLDKLDRSVSGSFQILNDRELLSELGMSDALAASYLGKSRQALNYKLGAKRSGAVSDPYFKISEILVLVIAARRLGREFNRDAVRAFVHRTKKDRIGYAEPPIALLDQLLKGVEDVDLADVGTVVLVLPAFADLRTELPDFSDDLKRLSRSLAEMKSPPWVAVFSSTEMQAEMAADWLGLPKQRTRWFTHEYVDHYVPMALVFTRAGATRPYVLTERGGLIPAPEFRAPMMAECVRFMLPRADRVKLFTYEPEDDEKKGSEAAEEEGGKVKPQKRA